jgi:hypothetical protein
MNNTSDDTVIELENFLLSKRKNSKFSPIGIKKSNFFPLWFLFLYHGSLTLILTCIVKLKFCLFKHMYNKRGASCPWFSIK